MNSEHLDISFDYGAYSSIKNGMAVVNSTELATGNMSLYVNVDRTYGPLPRIPMKPNQLLGEQQEQSMTAPFPFMAFAKLIAALSSQVVDPVDLIIMHVQPCSPTGAYHDGDVMTVQAVNTGDILMDYQCRLLAMMPIESLCFRLASGVYIPLSGRVLTPARWYCPNITQARAVEAMGLNLFYLDNHRRAALRSRLAEWLGLLRAMMSNQSESYFNDLLGYSLASLLAVPVVAPEGAMQVRNINGAPWDLLSAEGHTARIVSSIVNRVHNNTTGRNLFSTEAASVLVNYIQHMEVTAINNDVNGNISVDFGDLKTADQFAGASYDNVLKIFEGIPLFIGSIVHRIPPTTSDMDHCVRMSVSGNQNLTIIIENKSSLYARYCIFSLIASMVQGAGTVHVMAYNITYANCYSNAAKILMNLRPHNDSTDRFVNPFALIAASGMDAEVTIHTNVSILLAAIGNVKTVSTGRNGGKNWLDAMRHVYVMVSNAARDVRLATRSISAHPDKFHGAGLANRALGLTQGTSEKPEQHTE